MDKESVKLFLADYYKDTDCRFGFWTDWCVSYGWGWSTVLLREVCVDIKKKIIEYTYSPIWFGDKKKNVPFKDFDDLKKRLPKNITDFDSIVR